MDWVGLSSNAASWKNRKTSALGGSSRAPPPPRAAGRSGGTDVHLRVTDVRGRPRVAMAMRRPRRAPCPRMVAEGLRGQKRPFTSRYSREWRTYFCKPYRAPRDRTGWLGNVRLELRSVCANYPFERAHT